MPDPRYTTDAAVAKRIRLCLGGAVLICVLVVVATLTAPFTPHRIQDVLIPVGGEDAAIRFADPERYDPALADPEDMSVATQYKRVFIVYRPIWYLAALLLLPQVVGWLLRKNWVRIFSLISLAFLCVVLLIFVPEARLIQAPVVLALYVAYVALVLSPRTDAAVGAREITGFAFILPNFVGFLLWTSLPVVASFVLAFFKWDLIKPPRFIGFQNFVELFHDRLFWKYLGNTLFYMMSIPVSMLGSLFLATVLNQKLKGITLFRTLFYLPTVAGGIGMLILWKYIYNPDFGLLNQLLGAIGIDGPRWLQDKHWVKPALMLMGFWGGVGGGGMLLYLAALQNVDPGLYEAANIDGATAFQKFTLITIPMVSPTSFYIFIMSVIAGFQGGLEAIIIMTGGGPAGASATIGYYIYQNAFQWFNMGYAAALSWALFVIIFVVTLINWRWGGRTVIYD
ncbi:MAG: sugar ABC transporter permease [Planctomycetota bacterium]